MNLLANEIVERFYAFLWPMLRVSALLMSAPIFSLRSFNLRLRILLAGALTWMIYPLFQWPNLDPASGAGLLEIFNQIAIGLVMGLSLQIITAAILLAGQSISNAMGLSIATMMDPNLGNVPVIAAFMLILSTLIFVGLGGHAEHAAEVVGVRVRVDDRHDRALAEVGVGEVEARLRARLHRERIDHDPSRVTGDEGDVGDVVAACLPHARCDLEQAVDAVELGLTPKARVHRVGVGAAALDERVAVHVEHGAERAVDHARRVGGEQSSLGALEVGLVEVERSRRVGGSVPMVREHRTREVPSRDVDAGAAGGRLARVLAAGVLAAACASTSSGSPSPSVAALTAPE
eukprot:gene15738-33232_t